MALTLLRRRYHAVMRRVVFNIFALLSMLSFLITAVLWIRGQFAADHLRYHRDDGSIIAIGTTRTGVGFAYAGSGFPQQMIGWQFESDVPKDFELGVLESAEPNVNINMLSLAVWSGSFQWLMPQTIAITIVHVPFWLTLFLSALLPIRWLWNRRTTPRRRAAMGLCIACGYDLRGTESTAACPECGTARGGSSVHTPGTA